MGFFSDMTKAVRQGLGRATSVVTQATSMLNGFRDLPRLDPPVGQPASIPAVIARMHTLAETLPADDGVADFHRMYLKVTELVDAAVRTRAFQDPVFMERLDCVFAGLYLDAFRADDATRSRAWQPLFALRGQPHTAGLQYAVAGMNAHINYDLGVALVRACRQLGRTLDSPGVRDDFLAINRILADAMEEVRESFLGGIALQVDHAASPVLNLVGGWSIEAARDASWLSATVQWGLQRDEAAYAAYLDSRASLIGLVSRQLLTPVTA